MSKTGIDIAWDRPTIAQIKATGAEWVARYFSPDPTKNLTGAEVRDYTAAGLEIVTVWEGSATRALAGRAAGIADAQTAEQQRIATGLPSDMVIHFAVDTDTDWASVAPYFQGVISVLGLDRTGIYGGLKVIQGAHAAGIQYLWQTVAWSGGVWAPYATIRQPIGTTLGGQADYDTAEVADFGQYPRPSGGDMPLTPDDARTVWGYHGPGDNPDAHQTLQNIANGVVAANKAIVSVATSVAAVATAVAKLGTADAVLLADLQAAQTALAGIPAQVEAALKDGVVHVDVAVTGPAPAAS